MVLKALVSVATSIPDSYANSNIDSASGWHVFLVKLSWEVGTTTVVMSVAEFIKSESHFSTLQHQYSFLIS